jgi:(2Fe-2S) ferredoxin
MREAIRPRLHLFVCANRRTGSPLGPGCGDHGEAVYDALKQAVTDVARVWITKTHCLGICPKRGCTVARYPQQTILTEVTPEDVPTLLTAPADDSIGADVPPRIERELSSLEELQRKKVLDLARRLKPGLTLEDVQNPHDFPELDDPDWHYADGVLAGIASVRSALAALKKRDS